MKSNIKNKGKIKLYGLIRKKNSTIIILEKSEKFKTFLSNILGDSYCDLCMSLDKHIKNYTDIITSGLGHNHSNQMDAEIVYGKNKIFLFLNIPKNESAYLRNLMKFVEWVKVTTPQIKTNSKNRN